MIYTVTFNPSLDYIVSVPGFELGKTNRTESEQLLPGGLVFVQALLEKRLSVSFRYRASIQILFRWKMDVRVSI